MVKLLGTTESVQNCSFSAGGNSGAQAIFIDGASNPNIEGNTISGFEAGNGSIYLVGTSNAIVRNNRITAGTGGPDGIFGEKNTIDTTVDGIMWMNLTVLLGHMPLASILRSARNPWWHKGCEQYHPGWKTTSASKSGHSRADT